MFAPKVGLTGAMMMKTSAIPRFHALRNGGVLAWAWRIMLLLGMFSAAASADEATDADPLARDLLAHKNPHTGLTYAEDPAIAFVEINNENGLICELWGGSLDGMSDVYVAELTKQWNAWLAKKYPMNASLEAAWNIDASTPGDELLRNGDFAAKTEGWYVEQHDRAKQMHEASAGASRG